MRKQLYLDIKNCLKAILKEDETPVFKHFDLWNQQVDFLEKETPFAYPAIFIEFLPITWTKMGMNKQAADVTVKIHIVSRWYNNTADYNPQHLDALEYLELPDIVNNAITNFAPTAGNRFMRTASTINHNHETILDSIEEFVCNVIDISGCKQYLEVDAAPVVNVDNDTGS
ncbi:MAG: hypothetical protein RBR24_10830 [Candidatus Carbobacillus sp.]|nr:hypothetical protein [Candidatus Carbobacillus sp.]